MKSVGVPSPNIAAISERKEKEGNERKRKGMPINVRRAGGLWAQTG